MTTAANPEGTQPDIAGLSDDEFMQLDSANSSSATPADPASNTTPAADTSVAGDDASAQTQQTPVTTTTTGNENSGNVASNVEGVEQVPSTTEVTPTPGTVVENGQPANKEGDPKPDATSPAGSKTEVTTDTPPDYKSLYEEVIAPFKANGKVIELKDANEVRQMLQMGANYTRKMQEMAPHRKTIMMLEKGKMMDEGQIAFAIDLVVNRNPEAIKKLMKDAGIDPMDVDTSTEPAYREGNHRVSDQEVNFRSTLDTLSGSEDGNATLKVIDQTWDQASKEELWNDPNNMKIVHEHRQLGVYDRIAGEVERLKTLGTISPEVPFIKAYTLVGNHLAQQGAFAEIAPAQNPAPTVATPVAKVPVARTVATPKGPANNAAAAAASPTRSTPQPAKSAAAMMAASDDEFLASMAGRL